MSRIRLHLSRGLRELGPSQQNCGVNKAFWVLLSYTLDKLQAPATLVLPSRGSSVIQRGTDYFTTSAEDEKTLK